MDPMIIVFGLGVGVLIGLTGIGGGSLMTPLLVIFAGIQPTVAIGTDLAYGAVTKTLGGWRHLRQGTVDIGVSIWLAVGSLPGALIGVWLLHRLERAYGTDFEPWLLGSVAVALMIVALTLLFRAMFMPKLIAREVDSPPLGTGMKAAAVSIGFVLGIMLGLTSVGSGALIGLALILVFKMTPHRVVGTDVFHAAALMWAAGIAHWFSGNVDFVLMGNILIGSLPGVWIGSQLIHQVPATGLRPALGCVLVGSSLGILTKAGLDIPVGTIVGVPVAIGIVFALVHRHRQRQHHAIVDPLRGPIGSPLRELPVNPERSSA